MILVRNVNGKFGIFRFSSINLLGIVESTDDLVKLIKRDLGVGDTIKIPIKDTNINFDGVEETAPNKNTVLVVGKKCDLAANSVKVIDTPELYLSIDGVNVFVQSGKKSVEVGEDHSQDLRYNLLYALDLLLDDTQEDAKEFPAIGKPYWYVTSPSPLTVSVNQGVIDKELMDELAESECLGNVFRTRSEAEDMARKVSELFERAK